MKAIHFSLLFWKRTMSASKTVGRVVGKIEAAGATVSSFFFSSFDIRTPALDPSRYTVTPLHPAFQASIYSSPTSSSETLFGILTDTLDVKRSEEHTSELQSREKRVCRLPLEI